MLISILTLFPEVFSHIFSSSIIGRAQKKGLVEIKFINIRDFGIGKQREVDDKPYGGGAGMVMRVDVVERAIASAKCNNVTMKSRLNGIHDAVIAHSSQTASGQCNNEKVILLDPKGKTFDQSKARSFSKLDHLILVCGHYEGVDERISNFIDEKISIGEYILTGGEIPAMVIVDATIRLLKGVLIKKEATIDESFTKERELESPAYTRPKIYKSYEVPPVLLSGNHQKIKEWRKNHQILLK